MPLVKITPYECERNLLPRLCVKCGAPADDYVKFTVLSPFMNTLLGSLLVLCPPAFMVAAISFRRMTRPLKIPMCGPHRFDWEWRDAATSVSFAFVIVPAYCIAIGLCVFTRTTEMDLFAIAGMYMVLWTAWVAPASILWTHTVRATGLPRRGLQISGVH